MDREKLHKQKKRNTKGRARRTEGRNKVTESDREEK